MKWSCCGWTHQLLDSSSQLSSLWYPCRELQQNCDLMRCKNFNIYTLLSLSFSPTIVQFARGVIYFDLEIQLFSFIRHFLDVRAWICLFSLILWYWAWSLFLQIPGREMLKRETEGKWNYLISATDFYSWFKKKNELMDNYDHRQIMRQWAPSRRTGDIKGPPATHSARAYPYLCNTPLCQQWKSYLLK